MSTYHETPEYVGHADLEDPFEFALPSNRKDPCEGELTPEDIWKEGRFVNRVWTCDHCGFSLMEEEFLRTIESRGLIQN